ncbi:MAG: hypothetical protein WCJ40_16735 [Planctomycetota bacterium]
MQSFGFEKGRCLRLLSMMLVMTLSSGCGSKTESSGGASAEAQGKMSPEEVQKELQKISPPAGGKSKAKAK